MRAIIAMQMMLAVSLPGAVSAQGRSCAPRVVVVERLEQKYGETRQAIGIGQQGMVMETFASDETGSWTITVTMPTGMTCLMASGQAYESVAEDRSSPDGDET